MTYYFSRDPTYKDFRGKERTTLPTTLAKDLDRLNRYQNHDHTYCKQISLRNLSDLEHLRVIADDRATWRHLSEEIMKAAEAEVAVVSSATQH